MITVVQLEDVRAQIKCRRSRKLEEKKKVREREKEIGKGNRIKVMCL